MVGAPLFAAMNDSLVRRATFIRLFLRIKARAALVDAASAAFVFLLLESPTFQSFANRIVLQQFHERFHRRPATP